MWNNTRMTSKHMLRRRPTGFPIIQVFGIGLTLGVLCGFTGCGGGTPAVPPPVTAPLPPVAPAIAGRGFPSPAPWASCYGSAAQMGDLNKAAQTFRIINIDTDPGVGNFTPVQITQLKAGGRNRVIS